MKYILAIDPDSYCLFMAEIISVKNKDGLFMKFDDIKEPLEIKNLEIGVHSYLIQIQDQLTRGEVYEKHINEDGKLEIIERQFCKQEYDEKGELLEKPIINENINTIIAFKDGIDYPTNATSVDEIAGNAIYEFDNYSDAELYANMLTFDSIDYI